jgi:hypothetical protein
MVEDDWQYIALIVDRLLLFLYIIGCIVGSIAIFFRVWTVEKWDVFCYTKYNVIT